MARRPRRSQSTQEAEDAIRRAISRDGYASSVNERVFLMLRDLERDTVARMSTFDPSDPNVAQRRARLEKLQREVSAEIDRRYKLIEREVNGELPELAVNEARWKEASLRQSAQSTGANIDVALAPTPLLEALINEPIVLGGIAADYWKAEGVALSAKFSQQMQMGVASGENIGQLIARVRGTRAQSYKDGIMAVSRRNAESLVRTSVTSVANEAQMAVFRQNASLVQGIQQVSVMDQRTTIICFARNALIWKFDATYTPVGHSTPFQQPPLHWRCRSIMSSVLDIDDPPPMVTFNEFFNSMSKEEQSEMFGVGRAALFREGRISQKDLLSSTGKPLTLRQLTDRHGPPVSTKRVTPFAEMFSPENIKNVSMEDILTHPQFVAAEKAALALKPTLLDEDNVPDDFFDKRLYSRVSTDGKFAVLLDEAFDVGIDETLLNIRKRGEYFAGKDGPLYEKRATIVLGPPAAGKSTLAEQISEATRSAIIDVDEAKKFAREFSRGLGANAVHTESAVLTDLAFKDVYGQGMNLVLPKVGGKVSSIRKEIDRLTAMGYTVDVVNLNVGQDEAARRMGRRFLNSGRLIPSDFYRSIGNKPTLTYNEVKRSRGVRSYVEVDGNGGQDEQVITEGEGEILDWLRKFYGLF